MHIKYILGTRNVGNNSDLEMSLLHQINLTTENMSVR